MLQQQIEQDLKAALLAGDKLKVSVLRSLKSAITYARVAKGNDPSNEQSDGVLTELFAKEAKKRQESADLFEKGGRSDRAESELEEKKIIEKYLPEQLSEQELQSMIDDISKDMGGLSKQNMGQIIGQVKQESKGRADGGTIARLVQQGLK